MFVWSKKLIAALLALPFGLNDYTQFVVNTMLVYCLVALGFNVIIGYLGQLAFASAAFFGIGAYATGLSMAKLGLPFPVAIVVGAASGALVGGLVGLPALRVRGHGTVTGVDRAPRLQRTALSVNRFEQRCRSLDRAPARR